ncbi:MAG: hypothetical protein IKS97_05090 [Fibrobacter sp.]|nr:hypothetical protein [Fibrobacter sp.]
MKTEKKDFYTAPSMKIVELKHRMNLMQGSLYDKTLGMTGFDQNPVA